jgi:cytosine/adenosine deaminase-related metal-dependent hydrolase
MCHHHIFAFSRRAFCVASAALVLNISSVSAQPRLANEISGGGDLVLIGKVATMNATRDVLSPGAIWIRQGKIIAVAKGMADLALAAKQSTIGTSEGDAADLLRSAKVLRLEGVIYPGMIDLHNHPEYAIYPLLPIKRKYKDRYEWRFYDEAYARRITNLNTLLTSPQYFNLGTEVGKYGEIKALIGGTTSIQGARVTLPTAKEECLLRNIETAGVSNHPTFSRVDIGRDAREWQRMSEERSKGGALVLHLAEGVGPRMAAEFEAVKRSGLLGPELVAIHGVGLTRTQIDEMGAAAAKLVWSPLSNFILYGQTVDVAAAKRAGVLISLAPDWTPSGSKSILGELKVADLVNQHQLNALFSDDELVEMVTVNPATAIGWGRQLGQIAAGYLADLVVVDDREPGVYRNLIGAVEASIQLVVVRGEALYGDAAIMEALRPGKDLEPMPVGAGKRVFRAKQIAPNCAGTTVPPMAVSEISAKIQRALQLKFTDVAGWVSAEQMERDMKDIALCKTTGQASPVQNPPTVQDAKRFLACRFQLPFERTLLSPLTTAEDGQFFSRLRANSNLPRYLGRLSNYYQPTQGASRSIVQAPAP